MKLGHGECISVENIRFNPCFLAVDLIKFNDTKKDKFARLDGFDTWDDMMDFFAERIDFNEEDFVGCLYRWKLNPSTPATKPVPSASAE